MSKDVPGSEDLESSALPTADGPSPFSVDSPTPPSIFLKLKKTDAAPRELAWRQFYERYAPVIAHFARRRGATAQQADEVTQNVICGFFEASPRFVYDPERGRFRAYLKTCAGRALRKIQGAVRPAETVPVEELRVADARDSDDELWDRLWQEQILRRAMEIVRDQYTRKGKVETFLAFEHNVVRGLSALETATLLGMNVASVHTAKNRVIDKLREARAKLEDDEG